MSLTITCPDGSTARAYVSLPGSFTQRITKEIQLIIPDDANALTFTFDIYDGSGYPRYSISGLAKNTNHMILVERIVKPGFTYGMTPSANPAAAMAITVNPEYY